MAMFKNIAQCLAVIGLITIGSCSRILEPPPVDLLVDDLGLRGPDDMEPVRLGLYNAIRSFGSTTIFAGDFTADYIQNNGTFTDFNELGTKNITESNSFSFTLLETFYATITISNFIREYIWCVARDSEIAK